MSQRIVTADLDWQCIDGIDVPISKQFGDVYFSKDNGLLESRHVFLAGNDLAARFAALPDYGYFSVAETGFGTGLNILALWQLWQQHRPDNHSHLHAISVEKYPLTHADLTRALAAWPELAPLAEQLLAKYPRPLAGCHRLYFATERFSLDLWFGDAQTIFSNMHATKAIDAWFLDGFAPACNPDMWQEQVLDAIVSHSAEGTTFASFSVAGILKRGLSKHGITITRPRGFGHKREMLKAFWPTNADTETQIAPLTTVVSQPAHSPEQITGQRQIAVIGAGIAGLSCAWALAQRGHQVQIFDRIAPLSGASGNPLALLNPLFSQIESSTEQLMTAAWQYAMPYYVQFTAFQALSIDQIPQRHAEAYLALADQYPVGLLQHQSPDQLALDTTFDSLRLTQAGTVRPHELCAQILAHPNIKFDVATIDSIQQWQQHQHQSAEQYSENNQPQNAQAKKYQLKLKSTADHTTSLHPQQFDHVVLCCASASQQLIEKHPPLRSIRGQVSWLNNQMAPLSPKQAYSYGGYCMQLDAEHLILGASFHPDCEDTQVTLADHVHNYELIHNTFPNYAQQLALIDTWQGRASIRAQSLDYLPLLGKVALDTEIYTFSGLGSRGFLYAPLCSELLAALMLAEHSPVSQPLFNKLNVQRFIKQPRIKKPYYQGPYAQQKPPTT